jgi:uroporphyrinogen decarboxylase
VGDAIALDQTVPCHWARDHLQPLLPVQGNLDPLALRTGGAPLMRAVDQVLRDGADGPQIFNLGHGVTPDVQIEEVHAVINRIRNFDYSSLKG